MERLMNTWFRLGSLAVVLNFMILAVFFPLLHTLKGPKKEATAQN